ncbi:hypothetical protein EVA_19070 [gut metagenome]|uniref:Uncharacterized protein n=1 Tax=gut metagenome TaxID=749906 RepID=J9FEI2_9ZZZZ
MILRFLFRNAYSCMRVRRVRSRSRRSRRFRRPARR